MYGMALTISKEEHELIFPITAPAYANLALANDFFSWKKEYAEFKEEGKTYMVNAVWILMQEHSVSEEDAKSLLKRRATSCCEEYLRLKAEFENSKYIRPDLRKYLDALELAIPGNIAWNNYCPRYEFSDPPSNGHANETAAHRSNGVQNGVSNVVSNEHTNGLQDGSHEHNSGVNGYASTSNLHKRRQSRSDWSGMHKKLRVSGSHESEDLLSRRSLPALSDEVSHLGVGILVYLTADIRRRSYLRLVNTSALCHRKALEVPCLMPSIFGSERRPNP